MRSLIAVVCFALAAPTALARLVHSSDPLDGVLDAELVVTVQKSPTPQPGLFRILEVFLGDKKTGDTIDLGDFKLTISQHYGPDLIEPITDETCILLFLQRSKDEPTHWEPTYSKESFFWVQTLTQYPLLKRAAEYAVETRRQWEKAARIPDPKQRVAALWPFLGRGYCVSFLEHTEVELKRAAPASGEYFAAHFDGDGMVLLANAGAYGSEKLHKKIREYLLEEEQVYEKLVGTTGKLPRDIAWDTVPEEMRSIPGSLYYGLAGLGAFHDHNDLPFIRAGALWASQYHLEQMADSALDAFQGMPARANLPAIETVLKEFLPGRRPGIWSIDFDAERSLCQHKYPEAVSLLALFINDPVKNLAQEAHYCLTEIVGRDLGETPEAWIDWYKSKTRRTQ